MFRRGLKRRVPLPSGATPAKAARISADGGEAGGSLKKADFTASGSSGSSGGKAIENGSKGESTFVNGIGIMDKSATRTAPGQNTRRFV